MISSEQHVITILTFDNHVNGISDGMLFGNRLMIRRREESREERRVQRGEDRTGEERG